MEAYYPICSAAATGMCEPLNCREQAALGKCSAPFMREVYEASRTIVQVGKTPLRLLCCTAAF